MAIRISYEQTFILDDGTKLTREEYVAKLDALGVSYVDKLIPITQPGRTERFFATLVYNAYDPGPELD